MIYIASPYSHADKTMMEYRYLKVLQFTAAGVKARQMVHSPIVHCHMMARQFDLHRDFEFWRDYNFHMIDRSDELIVLGLEGWEESKGVWAEREFCQKHGIPVTVFEPHDFGWEYPTLCEQFWGNRGVMKDALDR